MPTSDPNVQWFLARDGKPHGPMTAAEMGKIVELGHLRDGDLVWRPGFAEWLPALQVFAPQPAPQMPAPVHAPASPAGMAGMGAPAEAAQAGPAPARQTGAPAEVERSWAMPAQQPVSPRDTRRPAPAGSSTAPGPMAGGARPASGPAPAGPLQGPRPGEFQADAGADLDQRPGRGRRPYAHEEAPPRRSRVALWLGGGLIVFALLAVSGLVIYQKLGAGEPRVASAPKAASSQPAPTPVKAQPPQVQAPPQKPLPVLPVDHIDKELQALPVWTLAKSEFPEWYSARLQDVARLRADRKDEAAVTKHLAEQIVVLRRQFTLHALAASPDKLKQVAKAFHANLAGLAKHSPEACFGFISLGELSPIVLKLSQAREHAGHLNAQVLSVLEAIADGRRKAHLHNPPNEQDYNMLSRELRGRGWTDADLQLFADARALSQTPPERVCRMVQDWFAGQLSIKDPATQLRLLVEALRPIVAG